jgi:hypothetical protein
LPGKNQTNQQVTDGGGGQMARYRRRTGTRRRYGYRRGRSGIDPLFWVALGVAVVIALFVVAG